MHRFRLILLPLCLFATATAIGQTVTGRIVDERQQPVAGVAVVMQTPDSVYVDAVASDLEGRFAHRIRRPSLPTAVPASQLRPADGGAFGRRRRHRYADRSDEPRGRSGRPGRTPLVKVEQGRLSYDLQVRPHKAKSPPTPTKPSPNARRERTRRGAHARPAPPV